MTLFGHDVSSYNPYYQPKSGEFVIVKASEGAHTHDPEWATLSARVKAAGAYLMAYHFLHSDSDPAAQAANTATVPGIRGVPLMVDVEVEGNSRPTIGQCAQYVDAARAKGLNPRLVYLPHWYWQEIGSPSLQPLISRGLHLVSSAYPQQGHYPGDSGSGWQPYGGMTPLIWQYSSQPLDCDAYLGTLAQLKAALGDAPAPKPPTPVTPTPTPATLVEEDVYAYLPPIPANTDVDIPVEPAGTAAHPQGGAQNGPLWLMYAPQGGSGTATVTEHTAKGWGKPQMVTLTQGHKAGLALPQDGSVDVVRVHSTVPLIAYAVGRQV